eukprot:4964347-Amphidinium_carterae.1
MKAFTDEPVETVARGVIQNAHTASPHDNNASITIRDPAPLQGAVVSNESSRPVLSVEAYKTFEANVFDHVRRCPIVPEVLRVVELFLRSVRVGAPEP